MGEEILLTSLLSRAWGHFKEYGLCSTVSAGYNLFIRRTFGFWERMGVHVTPNHFHQPIPDTRELRLRKDSIWKNSEMVGINMKKETQLRFLREYFPQYRDEYIHFPKNKNQTSSEFDFCFGGGIAEVDAEVLYCMVRHFKPSTVIEIGSGSSTLLIAQACQLNKREDKKDSRFITVDPYPPRVIKRNIPGLTRLIPQKVQEVDIEFFRELKSGDILFIDSSHVCKIGSDVNYLYLEVLPRLNTGVIVHSHDIFLPSEYPEKWVMGEHTFWTEQYLLQAFLTYNSAFEVLWGGAYMHINYPKELESVFPSYDHKTTVPGSFWFRRKAIKNER
jgi:hypothetical protein